MNMNKFVCLTGTNWIIRKQGRNTNIRKIEILLEVGGWTGKNLCRQLK